MRPADIRQLALAAGAALWTSAAYGQSAATTFVDLTAAAGYGTNESLRFDESEGGGFLRGSARGVHAWSGERDSTSLSAFVENSFYLNESGSRPIFAVNADTQHIASERVRLFGGVSFSGDFGGQLSTRFVEVPREPQVPDPAEPPPLTIEDPDFFAFGGRHYQLNGHAGAAITATERSSIGISGGAQRAIFTNDFLNDYTTLFASGSYNHTLSERTTVGGALNLRRTDYDNSGAHTSIINPAATIRTRLSENWNADASVGVLIGRQKDDGESENQLSLTLSGALCRTTDFERLCGRVSRDAQSASRASLVNSTVASIDWFRRLDEVQTVQLSAAVTRFEGELLTEEDFRSNHFRLAGSYSRRIGQRLSAGADVALRKLSTTGPDPETALSASLFLRYRIGDLL